MLDELMCSSGPRALLNYSDGRPRTAPLRAYRKQHLLAQTHRHELFSMADKSSFNVVESAENPTEETKMSFAIGKISSLNDALFKCNRISRV